MVKVLHVLHGLGYGGVESFIINIYRNIDRNKIQFDFLIRSNPKNLILKNEIEKLGGRIFITSEFPKNFLKNYKEVDKILKEENYDFLHLHANSLMYIKPIKLGKKNSIENIIVHSHSTQTANNSLYMKIHEYNKKNIYKYSKYRFACSEEAGKWMFGKGDYKIINNAIDVEKFKFNEIIRKEQQQKMNSENKFVIGVSARLSSEKNHDFLIDIFEEIEKNNENSLLILAGNGKLKNHLEEKVRNKGLEKKVKFLGAIDNVNEFLQGIDIFCMPSLYEGLSIALIEAQAAGLQVFTSENRVSMEVKITENLNFIDLDRGAKYWANEILKKLKYKRLDSTEEIKNNGYDIKIEAKKLEMFYLEKGIR